MTKVDRQGAHLIGYFSKEKKSDEDYNVACIVILPHYQKNGYGKFLIGLSYELTKREGKQGTPEVPISDLGKKTYRSFWIWKLISTMENYRGIISIDELVKVTGILKDDVIETLDYMNLNYFRKNEYVICIVPKMFENIKKSGIYKEPPIVVDSECLV